MPPKKPDGQVQHEAHLARQIHQQREARDLTLERLAQKMTEAGCPMDRSAIYKIESGNPPRRITLNEAVTFANVFGMTLASLMVPPSVATSREATKLFRQLGELEKQTRALTARRREVLTRLLELVDAGYEMEVENVIRETGFKQADLEMMFWRIAVMSDPEENDHGVEVWSAEAGLNREALQQMMEGDDGVDSAT